jgi:hypothetical protein
MVAVLGRLLGYLIVAGFMVAGKVFFLYLTGAI